MQIIPPGSVNESVRGKTVILTNTYKEMLVHLKTLGTKCHQTAQKTSQIPTKFRQKILHLVLDFSSDLLEAALLSLGERKPCRYWVTCLGRS